MRLWKGQNLREKNTYIMHLNTIPHILLRVMVEFSLNTYYVINDMYKIVCSIMFAFQDKEEESGDDVTQLKTKYKAKLAEESQLKATQYSTRYVLLQTVSIICAPVQNIYRRCARVTLELITCLPVCFKLCKKKKIID